MPAPSTCTVSGTLYGPGGSAVSGVKIKVYITTAFVDASNNYIPAGIYASTTSDSDGAWSLAVVRTASLNKTVTFRFEYPLNNTQSYHVEYPATIPDQSTANFTDIVDVNDNSSLVTGSSTTDLLPEGSTNLYFTEPRVLATPLTGFVSSPGTINSSDTILQAFEKIGTVTNTQIARRYIDFTNGSNSNDGSAQFPWKTLAFAYSSITDASPTNPYVFYLNGGTGDTDSGTISAKPSISLDSDYPIIIAAAFTISGGVTGDICAFRNITFNSTFTWTRNDTTAFTPLFTRCVFNGAVAVRQSGAGVLNVFFYYCTNTASINLLAIGGGINIFSQRLSSSLVIEDGTTLARIIGCTLTSSLTVNGNCVVSMSGNLLNGATFTSTTTGSGTPTFITDSSSIPASISGSFNSTYTSNANHTKYTPTTSSDWSSIPTLVLSALDGLASSGVFKSQSANKTLVSPNGSSGLPSFRSLVAADLPVGTANGVAGLDSGGKVPVAQLPSSLMEYQGAWSASTNSPTLADGTGDNGDVYRASTAGTQNLGSGSQTWAIGDLAIYNGSIWQHSPAADGVSSVNGNTGAVTVNAINQLSGDITTALASGSQGLPATLATVNGNVGSFGTATNVSTITVNGKGLITAASNTAIQITESQVTNLTSDLAAKLSSTGTGLVEALPGMIETPTNKTYILDQSAAYGYTINTLIIATVSGTITAAVKINGTNVTSISAVSVSSTPTTATASGANTVSAGDKITLVLSSNSTAVDLSFTLKVTRT